MTMKKLHEGLVFLVLMAGAVLFATGCISGVRQQSGGTVWVARGDSRVVVSGDGRSIWVSGRDWETMQMSEGIVLVRPE